SLLRATKSVSQFTSTIAPTRPSPGEYSSIMASEVSRADVLATLERPFSRKHSSAFSISPSDCSSALRQSMMPAPVSSRSCLICSVLTAMLTLRPRQPQPHHRLRPHQCSHRRPHHLLLQRPRLHQRRQPPPHRLRRF